MSETTQEFRDAFRRQIEKDGDADIYPGELIALFNDADRLARAEELLQGVEDCIDHMDDRDFGGDVMEESMRWVEKYREEVKTFLSGNG